MLYFSARLPRACLRKVTPSPITLTSPASLSVVKVCAGRAGNNDPVEPRRYFGVKKLRGGRFAAHIKIDGVARIFGVFDTQEEAARCRDLHIIRFFGPLPEASLRIKFNHTLDAYQHNEVKALKTLEEYQQEWASAATAKPVAATFNTTTASSVAHPQSRFRGVYYRTESGKWQAQVRLPGGPRRSAGLHLDEEIAARSYDAKAYQMLGGQAKLNFPEDVEKYQASSSVQVPDQSSQYRGVSYVPKRRGNQKWFVRLYYGGKLVFCKRCSAEQEAACAYDNALMKHLPKDMWASRVNFPLEDSSSTPHA